ncbi:ABC transporter ATP-binding protein [Rhodococcus koreensis]|uniref:ABC transporter ATP-binding protein n=1 Tax=Rhodococcus koreensis TaxID=99653 RepID=UPI0036724971
MTTASLETDNKEDRSSRSAGPTAPPGVVIRDLVKSFVRVDGTEVRAIDEISIDVEPGEFLILLGPSGCGKTTLLRAISGLDEPNSGSIRINGTPVYDSASRCSVAPERRPIGMVFQSYGLWPHMSVRANIAYPLKNRKMPKAEIKKQVERVAAMVGITPVLEQYPTQLSGGQQQRVAVARAIVSTRSLLLFDEPLSNVDAKVRDQLRIEILRMQRELGFTAVYVTHDQEEAMALGTRIAVLQEGRIAQLASPREIYDKPSSPYVARFVGTVDEFDATIVSRRGGEVDVETATGLRWTVRTSRTDLPEQVLVLARPERWTLDSPAKEHKNALVGIVETALFLVGSRTEYIISTTEGDVRVLAAHGDEWAPGSTVSLRCLPEDFLIFGTDE